MDELGEWYYSAQGGLLLTSEARSAFVALQTLLESVSRLDWQAVRPPTGIEARFAEACQIAGVADVGESLEAVRSEDWPSDGIDSMLDAWKDSMGRFAAVWSQLQPEQRFSVLHQVASRLRTVLTRDVDSRLR